MKTSREVWAKRVQRWQESDLTAAEFAAEIGINARTLSYWKWRLGKEARETSRRSKRRQRSTRRGERGASTRAKFVEVTGVGPNAERIELVVDAGVVVRVPDGFEAETLRRVLATMSSKDEA
jgi:hypothetical protein